MNEQYQISEEGLQNMLEFGEMSSWSVLRVGSSCTSQWCYNLKKFTIILSDVTVHVLVIYAYIRASQPEQNLDISSEFFCHLILSVEASKSHHAFMLEASLC